MRVYKPSGIKWLGEIPKHWEIRRLKYLFYISKEESRDEFPNVLSLTQNGIIERDITTNKGQLAQNYIGYNIVKRGDIILNPMDLSSGYAAKSTFEGVISQAYIKIRPLKTLNLSYYESFFQNLYHYKILWHLGKGISYDHRWTLGNDVFLNIKIPLPPLQEQKEIAEFLDSKCEKIQNYIEKKQKLITFLQEKKQALINEAVCGRVACHTERSEVSTTAYKPSDIEYLGLIPHHWEVVRSGLIYKNISSGTTPQSDNDEYYKNGNIFWINSGDLNDSVLTNSKNKITQKAMMAHSALKIFPKGSLIIAMYGATIGKVSILGIDACTNQACCVLCESKYLNTRFVFYYFVAKRQDLISMAYGGGQPNISQDIIKNFKIPLPPLQEQKQIANFLDKKCEKINSAIEKTKRQIKLIKEYKNTLINEAVCGRVACSRDFSPTAQNDKKKN